MRLCLVAPTPPPYGGVANWELIVENSIRKDAEIELYIINIAVNKRPLDGRTLFDRLFHGGYVLIKSFRLLRRQVKYNKPDIVHMTTSGGLGFYRDLLLLNYLKWKGIPSVYHIHFGRTVFYKSENGRCWRQIKKAVLLAKSTIVIDHPTYEILKDYSNSIVKINNPIEVDEYKHYFEDSEEENYFVYVGWIIQAKGIAELITGFNQFNTSQKYKLFLVGPGDNRYINSLMKQGGDNIVFTGEVSHDKTMEYISKSMALILPSYTEGFPNVILEAMALRKCVVATNVGAIPEILADGAGIIIEPRSVPQIVTALQMISDDVVRSTYAFKGYNRVRKLYDAKETYEKYKNVWKKVV